MTNLETKKKEFLLKMREGNRKDYRMIVYNEDTWLYCSATTPEPAPILMLHVFVDNGCGMDWMYSFSCEDEPTLDDGDLSPMIFNLLDNELIVEDVNGLHGFGIRSDSAEGNLFKAVMIYFRTEHEHGVAFANKDSVALNTYSEALE